MSEHTFSSKANRLFAKTHHSIGHTSSLQFKNTQVKKMFSDHNGIKLEVHNGQTMEIIKYLK